MAARKLKDALVVITGATSGIGRATALAFAAQGSHLVLAARDPEGLNQTAIACRERGALVHTNVTDVTNSAAVTFLAEYAAELGDGRIDVWINNAGVGAVGDFLETPLEAHEQVIRTNLFGYLYGAYAALPYFVLHQKGVLINNVSFGAWFPAPYAAAYSASKFGIEGFSDALRGELSRWRQIRICDVYPAFVNTPGIAEHAANYAERNLGSSGLAVEPEKVAEVMVDLARRPRNKVTIGALARATRAARTLSPGITRTLTSRLAERIFASGAPQSSTSGALFEPQPGNRVLGANPRPRRRLRAAAAALSVGSSAVLLGHWLGSEQGKRALGQTRSWLKPKLKLLKP